MHEEFLLKNAAFSSIDPADCRRIDCVVTGLPFAGGVPVAVDATVVSPLHADGTPHPGADQVPGKSFERARRSKERTYPELVGSAVLRLVVAAHEVGGKLCPEALQLLEVAAAHKALKHPAAFRGLAARTWRARWLTILSVAVQDSVAASLVGEGLSLLEAPSGPPPEDTEVLMDLALLAA